MIRLVQGALICESEGISVADYGKPCDQRSVLLGNRTRERARRIHEGRLFNTGATLAVWSAAAEKIRANCIEQKINAEFPELLLRFFHHAKDAGLSKLDVAPLIRVLRLRT